MSRKSKIEWTGTTWNPTTGCTKCSPGCANCYAETMSRRLKAMGQKMYKDGFEVRTHEDRLDIPFRWTKPKLVFVDSMSDLFHVDIPDDFILKVFDVMERCPQHIFQILTKRTGRMEHMVNFHKLPALGNVWLGTSVEDEKSVWRAEKIRTMAWGKTFLSIEPLLGPLGKIRLDGIGWVIAGGESGFNARPTHPDWVREIRDQCAEAGVPFFFKQWGMWWPAGKGIVENARMIGMGGETFYLVGKKRAGRMLDGRIHEGMPDDMRKIKPFFVEG